MVSTKITHTHLLLQSEQHCVELHTMDAPVAIVTGGASGIGLGIAEHLIQFHGYRVAILDMDESRVKEQSDRLGSQHCLGLEVDVTDYNQQAQAFVKAFEWGGNRLDLFF